MVGPIIKEIVGYEEPLVDSCVEMKKSMQMRFVSSYYHRYLHYKLQKLTHSSKSLDDYYKDMEVCLIRGNISEDKEAIMTHSLQELDSDVRDVVELQNYVEVEELMDQATKVNSRKRVP